MNNVIFWSGIWSSYSVELQRPIGCYQLAHWLRKHRIDSQVIEFLQLMTTKEIIELTEMAMDSSTFAIAVGTSFWPRNDDIPLNVRSAIFILKLKYPKLEFVAGGRRVQHLKKLFDKVFHGYSEDLFLKYCQEKKYKSSLPNASFDIVNLDHRFIKKDVILPNEHLPIEFGRGCIFKCKFCNYPMIGKKKHTYQRRQELIVDEMRWNYDQFGTSNYISLDDTTNEDPDKVNFFTTIKDKIGVDITWTGYLRLDLIHSHKNHNQLFDSGLRNAYFGLETFNPKTANIIGKGWNGRKAKEWLPVLYNDLWGKRVAIESTFIVGLPEESEKSMFETAKWVNEINAGLMSFLPFNLKQKDTEDMDKSEFTRNHEKYGYKINDNGLWEHKSGMTETRSLELAKELNNTVKGHWRPGGFRSISFLNFGFTQEETSQMHFDSGMVMLRGRIREFLDRYIKLYKEVVTAR